MNTTFCVSEFKSGMRPQILDEHNKWTGLEYFNACNIKRQEGRLLNNIFGEEIIVMATVSKAKLFTT